MNYYALLNAKIFSSSDWCFRLIISRSYRSRVPQMASNVSQRRAGTVLPPPAEDFSYSAVVAAKHPIKNGITVCFLY
jgi:hypothetical protein